MVVVSIYFGCYTLSHQDISLILVFILFLPGRGWRGRGPEKKKIGIFFKTCK